ncbi:hypothetical protein T02_6773 [Trichinella nativa]|uniref:Integrase zinc-binding domain-containing protein n=1 Tax=Trichinella nativa TaxID=6335 RepID=A0A0V1KPW9_9BILA|nr:hypothetical protein T02_6773 [Trichinella nativa]
MSETIINAHILFNSICLLVVMTHHKKVMNQISDIMHTEWKKGGFEKNETEETKPILAIYDEEASAASAVPTTSGHFPLSCGTTIADEDFLLWQSASSHILVLATGSNIRLMATRRTWALDGKREPGRSGNRAGGRQAEDTSAQRNPPVDDGPSSLGDDCPNNPCFPVAHRQHLLQRMNVKLWLDRLKNYLIDCEMARSRWTTVGLSFFGDDVLARLFDLGRRKQELTENVTEFPDGLQRLAHKLSVNETTLRIILLWACNSRCCCLPFMVHLNAQENELAAATSSITGTAAYRLRRAAAGSWQKRAKFQIRKCQPLGLGSGLTERKSSKLPIRILMAATLQPTLVIILGVVGGISCSLTIDTGAMVSIIEESMVADASDVQIHPNVNLRVRGLGKSPSADLDVIGTAMITVELSEISVKHPALVVRGLGHSCLLENDFLIEHGVKVDFSNQTVHIRNRTFHFYSEERRLWRKRQTMKFERVATRTVSDGVFFSEDKQNKVNLRRKLVVPKLIRSQALEALHDCLYAGHFEEKHTWESVNQRLYSRSLRKGVRKWIDTELVSNISSQKDTNDCPADGHQLRNEGIFDKASAGLHVGSGQLLVDYSLP